MPKILSLITAFAFLLSPHLIKAQEPVTSVIQAKAPVSPKKIIIKYGIASFYAVKFTGRKTARGERFNPQLLTAACNVLPLGTWVKVTNLKNDKTVIVEINDRLYPKNKRLIDLTKTAAQKLGFVNSGTTRVKVEVLGQLKKHKS